VEVDKWLVANSDQSITIRPSPWRRPARVPGGGGSASTICECAWQWLFYLAAAMRAAELRNGSTGRDVTC
jgi:hypothetical protein